MKEASSQEKKKSGNVSHPLNGSNLGTLWPLLTKSGPIPPQKWTTILGLIGSAIGRSGFTLLERPYTRYKFSRMPEMPSPVFIIGHWRSGTTHLGNILSKAPDFGYVSPIAAGLPWNILLLGSWFRTPLQKALPKSRLIDSVKVTPESPQEDEFGTSNMIPLSFFHALYFPHKFEAYADKGIFFEGAHQKEIDQWKRIFTYFLKKVYIDQGYKQLMIRNPVYTARIRMIRSCFPQAKFIYIYRNPYHLFRSMRNYYHKLFPALALQEYKHVDIDTYILKTHSRMIERLNEEKEELATHDFVEVAYEQLDAEPLMEMERIYRTLELPHFDRALPQFEAYLRSVGNYKKNSYPYDEEMFNKVNEAWGNLVIKGNYQP